jgi:hypothetical protein
VRDFQRRQLAAEIPLQLCVGCRRLFERRQRVGRGGLIGNEWAGANEGERKDGHRHTGVLD